jgi:hypothetical protein
VHELFSTYDGFVDKPLEYQTNKSDPYIPNDPPEVYSTSVSLPYINLSIRINGTELKKLKQLISQVFPKTYYIEVE